MTSRSFMHSNFSLSLEALAVILPLLHSVFGKLLFEFVLLWCSPLLRNFAD